MPALYTFGRWHESMFAYFPQVAAFHRSTAPYWRTVLAQLADAMGLDRHRALMTAEAVAAGAFSSRPPEGSRRSTMLPGGVPLEISVELRPQGYPNALRYNVDPGDQRLPSHARAMLVRATMAQVLRCRPSHAQLNDRIFEILLGLRSSSKFSAWLGIVDSPGRSLGIRCYHSLRGVTMSPAELLSMAGLDSVARWSPYPNGNATIVALDSRASGIHAKLYFRHRPTIPASGIRELTARAGISADTVGELLSVVAQDGLPEGSLMTYISLSPSGNAAVNTYVASDRTCSSDREVSDGVHVLCQKLGLDPAPYDRLVEVLPVPAPPGQRRHGYLGIGLDDEGLPRLKIYVRPTWKELGL